MTPELRGFPIRTSTDQSSFTNSPWLIAGYNVLHRLLMPRHPPIALSSLSPNKPTTKTTKDARVHSTILKQHTHHNTHQETPADTMACQPNQPAGRSGTQQRAHPPHPTNTHPFHTPPSGQYSRDNASTTQQTRSMPSTTTTHTPPNTRRQKMREGFLLRKEVIQPHLPVRLPCYDLVLITDPTLDGSPHKG